MAKISNLERKAGSLVEVIKGADVFIGVSAPGIFRGALDVRASDINDEMKIAAAEAIASVIPESELSPDYIIPDSFNPHVKDAVAEAVKAAARRTGVARI